MRGGRAGGRRLSADRTTARGRQASDAAQRPAAPRAGTTGRIAGTVACGSGGLPRRPGAYLALPADPDRRPYCPRIYSRRRGRQAGWGADSGGTAPGREADEGSDRLCRMHESRLPRQLHGTRAEELQELAAEVREVRAGHRVSGHPVPHMSKMVCHAAWRRNALSVLSGARAGRRDESAGTPTSRAGRRRSLVAHTPAPVAGPRRFA